MTKKSENISYENQVGRFVLDYYGRMLPYERKQMYKLLKGQDRSLKYLYAYMNLPLPLQAYIWGVLPQEEAVELVDAKMIAECEKMDEVMNSPASNITEVQRVMYEGAVKGNMGVYMFDIRQLLTEIGIPEKVQNQVFLSYPAFFQKLLMDEKYNIDIYTNIMRRFKSGYLQSINRFNKLNEMYVDWNLNLTQSADFALDDAKPIQETGLNRTYEYLSLIENLLDWSESRKIQTPAMIKCSTYAGFLLESAMSRAVKEMGMLPAHGTYRGIKSKMQSMSQVFSSFFRNGIDKKLELYEGLALIYAREMLKDGAKDLTEEKYLLSQFDMIVGQKVTLDMCSEAQKQEEIKNNKLLAERLYLVQKIFKAAYLEEQPLNQMQQQNDTDISELEQAIVEVGILKNKYLSADERYDPRKSLALFSFMRDYELLYTIGVLNRDEYVKCQERIKAYLHEDKGHKIKDYTVVDVFTEELNDLELKSIMPLTKQNMETAEQIRLASLLYQDFYTDNSTDKIDLKQGYIFENDYMSASTPLRQEGLFLEDMILLARHLGNHRSNGFLKQLLDSYWNESVAQLIKIPPYKNRPEVGKQIQNNLIFFNTDEETLLKNKDTFEKRKPIYQQLIAQLNYEVMSKFDNDYAVRNDIIGKLTVYEQPFMDRCKITHNGKAKRGRGNQNQRTD